MVGCRAPQPPLSTSSTTLALVMDTSLKRLRNQQEPFTRQLAAASNLVSIVQQQFHSNTTATTTSTTTTKPATVAFSTKTSEPVIAASVKTQLLRWIEKLAKTTQDGTTKQVQHAVTFWSVVQFVLQRNTATEDVVSVSPFLAKFLCDTMLHALRAQDSRSSHELIESITTVFELAFSRTIDSNRRPRSAVFPVAPEQSIRFMADIIKTATSLQRNDDDDDDDDERVPTAGGRTQASERLLISVLSALVPALENLTNPKKKFKLMVEILLLDLLSLYGRAASSSISWGKQCVEQIRTILQRSLFSPVVLETFERSMPDTIHATLDGEDIPVGGKRPLSSSSSCSLRNDKKKKKRRKNEKGREQESKFASFQRCLFDELVHASSSSSSSSTSSNAEWMRSVPLLLQLFVDSNVALTFQQVQTTTSEHDRTRKVQEISFKFFTMLQDILLPEETSSSHVASRLSSVSTMMDLICQRNIFVRSNHGVGINHKAVVEQLLKRVGKWTKKKEKKENIDEAVALPALSMMISCLHMDHNFWTRFAHEWTPLLHTWSTTTTTATTAATTTTTSTVPTRCVDVFVTSVQRFAKVRQLDVYTKLLCEVLQAPTVGTSLACEGAFQQAVQDAVVACPAGQIEVLFTILKNEMTSR